MEIDSELIQYLVNYGWIAIFFGSFFLGGSLIAVVGFLGGTGVWTVPEIILYCYVGNLVSDTIFFYSGQRIFKWMDKMQKRVKAEPPKDHEATLHKIQKYTGRRTFITLLAIKFIFASRVLTLLYITSQKLSFTRFSFDNLGTTAILTAVMLSVGWLVAKEVPGADKILSSTQYFSYVILGVVVILVARLVWGRMRRKKQSAVVTVQE
ncbi:MAG: hypothetical protein ABIG66_02915 [Candidatus Kerfeldbacteria bacterium]|nr:hypothetical protein [Verrucomicrobiota bacterium]